MLFNSIDFMIFFPIVLIIYYVLPKRMRQYWLLLSSYYFYMCWNVKYALLILASTIITYISGLIIEKVKRNQTFSEYNKKRIGYVTLIICLVSNLGILVFFKYSNFLLHLISMAGNLFHMNVSIPVFDIILPVGISFYTFQALGYTIDVSRDTISAEKNFFKYALFVSFFPQLVAGPIERSKKLLTQLDTPKEFEFARFREGIYTMVWGYFLKVVIADRIAIFVDTIYGDFVTYSGYYLIVATILFGIQIYCDFYGYSTIAVGAAHILGIELMENFRSPYLSVSVAEFWRNWHISLTSWFRDYLYIPLGGNKRGKIRKYVNIMIVFLVSGLWHGANLTYVVWGGINGFYQIVGEVLAPVRKRVSGVLRLTQDAISVKILKVVITFALVDFSWIFFRANTLYDAARIVHRILVADNIWILVNGSLNACGLDNGNLIILCLSLGVLFFADLCKRKGIRIRTILLNQPYLCRCFCLVLSILVILVFGKWGPAFDKNAFIYFQF